MPRSIFRVAALTSLGLLLIGLWRIAVDIDGSTAPKAVGGAAVCVLVAVDLLLIALIGARRPTFAMMGAGAGGVMLFAAATAFTGVTVSLLWTVAIAMFALCLWSAVTLVDRVRDDPRSHL